MLKLLEAVGRAFWSPAPYLSWAAISALLAISGPFGTFDRLSLAARLGDFALVVGLCIIWGVVARVVIQHVFPQLSFWPASLLVIAFSSVALALPVRSLVWDFAGIGARGTPSLPVVALLIACFGLSVAVLRCALATLVAAPAAQEAPQPEAAVQMAPPLAVSPPPPAPLPRLLDRIPPELRGPIVRVSGRNHYVEIVTEKGSSLVLLRLSDAMAELDSIDGAQVHRSHWVAANAVVGSEREGVKRILLLGDGSRIPVGRSYQDRAERFAQG